MKIHETPLKDLYLVEPRVFQDNRGYFFESFNARTLENTPLAHYDWVQDNESQSTRGVLRGLHFQKGEFSQAKWVRVISGEVFDVAVDLRQDSPSFGKWYGKVLSGSNKLQLVVPRGFAHGFLVLSETATFTYKCDNYYSPKNDSGIKYNDPDIDIEWPMPDADLLLSEKDKQLEQFKKAFKF